MRRQDFETETEYQHYLEDCADIAEAQALANPSIGVPLDPAVAEFMGAFVEDSLGV